MRLPYHNITPHYGGVVPICLEFKELVNAHGMNNFGDGSAFPLNVHWLTAITQYWRPAKLFIRKGSFYEAVKRSTGSVLRVPFGPQAGELRIQAQEPHAQIDFQYQLTCPANATVSQTITKTTGEEGDLMEYQITAGYTMFSNIAAPGPAHDTPPWALKNTVYLGQTAAFSAYFIEDTQGRPIISALPPNIDDQTPKERYAQIGTVEIDFRDQFKANDNQELIGEFPLYRDVWFEDGLPPFSSPLAWYSSNAKLRICWMGWDYSDFICPEVPEEMTP